MPKDSLFASIPPEEDANKNTTLSLTDLENFYAARIDGPTGMATAMRQALQAMDHNGDGIINAADTPNGISRRMQLDITAFINNFREILREYAQSFDFDHDHKLSVGEVKWLNASIARLNGHPTMRSIENFLANGLQNAPPMAEGSPDTASRITTESLSAATRNFFIQEGRPFPPSPKSR